MALTLGIGAVFMSVGGLLHFSRKGVFQKQRMMKYMDTTTLGDAARELWEAEGLRPSKYVEFYGYTDCKKPVERRGTSEKVVAHLETTYRKEREVTKHSRTEQPITHHSEKQVASSLREGDGLLFRDVNAQAFDVATQKIKEEIEQRRKELSGFGSVLSRSKYLNEIKDMEWELSMRSKCNTTTKTDPKHVSIRDLMVDDGSTFEKPEANVVVTVNSNNDNNKAAPQITVEGYRTVHMKVPLGKQVYCLGKLTLDKVSCELTFGRDPDKPFVVQYGTEQDVLERYEMSHRIFTAGMYTSLALGSACIVSGTYNLCKPQPPPPPPGPPPILD
ncbi:hypothetical protein AAMO2058_001487100 [Amorphochlora amoebiformis]